MVLLIVWNESQCTKTRHLDLLQVTVTGLQAMRFCLRNWVGLTTSEYSGKCNIGCGWYYEYLNRKICTYKNVANSFHNIMLQHFEGGNFEIHTDFIKPL